MRVDAATTEVDHPSAFDRRKSDEPPHHKPRAQGFVEHFFSLLTYGLTQQGPPKGVAWIDRCKIEHAEDFTEVVREALAHLPPLFRTMVETSDRRARGTLETHYPVANLDPVANQGAAPLPVPSLSQSEPAFAVGRA
jgi:hypothetical protein